MENNDDDLKVPGPVEWNFCVQVYSWQQGERAAADLCCVVNFELLSSFYPAK